MPDVTIAIPTYNRANLLEKSLASAVAQNYDNLEIVVLDNASTDHTRSVVMNCVDSRVRYLRNNENFGLYRNFRAALSVNNNQFICILQDDDLLHADFIRCSVAALIKTPNAAFSVSRVQAIDMEDNEVSILEDTSPLGILAGHDYLEGMVNGRNWVIHMSSSLMRTESALQVGGYDNAHSGFQIDLSLYLRMAAKSDLLFLPDTLASIRIHDNQDTAARFRTENNIGPLVTLAERMDGAALLLNSERAKSPHYRKWLSDKLLHLSERRSDVTAKLLPSLNISDQEIMVIAEQELMRTLPDKAPFLLIDEESWRSAMTGQLNPIPFPELGGYFNGVPIDDSAAIDELQRQLNAGIAYLAIAKPSLWWLDYYSGMKTFLESTAERIVDSSFLKLYKLNSY